jgi:hypothetical protein
LDKVSDVANAAIQIVNQLPGPRQQIATLGTRSFAFSQPLTREFHNVTVRQAFNEIARLLGPTYGWQFSGADDFRLIIFHERLAVSPIAAMSNWVPHSCRFAPHRFECISAGSLLLAPGASGSTRVDGASPL